MSTTTIALATAPTSTILVIPSATITYDAGSPQSWSTVVPAMDPISTFQPVPWKFPSIYIGGQIYHIFELTTTPSLDLPVARTPQTCSLKLGYVQYFPNLPANAFFAATFGVFLLTNLYFTMRRHSWRSAAVVLACAIEALGFASRLQLQANPFSQQMYLLQFICLSVGPTILLALIRFSFDRLACLYCSHHSKLHPAALSMTFLISDYSSLLLQCAGAGIAVSSIEGSILQAQGIDTLLVGLALQLFSLSLFVALCTTFTSEVWRKRNGIGDQDKLLRSPAKWAYSALLAAALLLLALRTLYRPLAFQAGLSSTWAQLEAPLLIFEGGCVVLAALLLTIANSGLIPIYISTNITLHKSPSEDSPEYPNLVGPWQREKGAMVLEVSVEERPVDRANSREDEEKKKPSVEFFPCETLEITVEEQSMLPRPFSFQSTELPVELLAN